MPKKYYLVTNAQGYSERVRSKYKLKLEDVEIMLTRLAWKYPLELSVYYALRYLPSAATG
jgi:hypothetical protein